MKSRIPKILAIVTVLLAIGLPAQAGILKWLVRGGAVGGIAVVVADDAMDAAVARAVLAYGTAGAAIEVANLNRLIAAHPFIGQGHVTKALANVAMNDPRTTTIISEIANETTVGSTAVEARKKFLLSVSGVSSTPPPDPQCDFDETGITNATYQEQRIPPTSFQNKIVNIAIEGVESRVAFDSRGFPDFSPYAIADVRIVDTQTFFALSHERQLALASKELGKTLVGNESLLKLLSKDQIEGIITGQARIKGFVWHHHQDPGRMQLVMKDIHSAVFHYGGWYANACLQDPPRR